MKSPDDISFRPFEPERDKEAVHRIWEEAGWIDRGDEDDAAAMDSFLGSGHAEVAEVNGAAESLVTAHGGDIRHLDDTLGLSAITAVTTSLVARKLRTASTLTARAIARAARMGQALSVLGMFEQGYYSRLGFGTGPYERLATFNPGQLKVPDPSRPPIRLSSDDYEELYQAMQKRLRNHGGVTITGAQVLRAEMEWTEDPVGLGFRDASGELTHFLFGSSKGEHGPFEITALAYRSREQLLELMSLLHSLANQIYLVEMYEPPHLQIQDLLDEPLRSREKSEGGEYAERILADALWQLRINDLQLCLANTHLPVTETLSLNLELKDPITKYLDGDCDWRGLTGQYTIHFGQESAVADGHRPGLPLLRASVGGLSRLWLGCASASAIALGGELRAEDALLDRLDRQLCLPQPSVGWSF